MRIEIIDDFATFGGSRLRKDRNSFKLHPPPDSAMSKPPKCDPASSLEPPSDLGHFVTQFFGVGDVRERLRWTLRDSIDELLDGQRTGRWCYQHLSKTEKTHLGTAIEVNITKEFDLQDGQHLDWEVNGEDLDCKFSKDFGGWEIPMEMYLCADHGEQSGVADHPALLLWADDDNGRWAAGLVRITDARLRFRRDGSRAYNRDNKRRLSEGGLDAVHWLWGGIQDDLPPNQLRQMSSSARDRVFSGRSGQQRVNQLFRELPTELINRATVATVAQQDDPLKRARDARLTGQLGNEGFIVLGHQEADPHIAELLGLPVPVKGEFVACRVRRANDLSESPRVFLDGDWWTTANPDDTASRAPSRERFKKSSRELLEHGIEGPEPQTSLLDL